METITKTNLLQFILGLVLTAVCGICLNMNHWGVFPCVLVAITWGAMTASDTADGKTSTKRFWTAAACVMAGAAVMSLILLGV